MAVIKIKTQKVKSLCGLLVLSAVLSASMVIQPATAGRPSHQHARDPTENR